MPALNITHPALSAQKLTSVIQSNSRFCTACQFGQHCGDCVCCKSHHLPLLADGVYSFGSDFVIILGGDEVAWSEDHTQAARSLVEMSEAELAGVLE
jgi:hypothetical protein